MGEVPIAFGQGPHSGHVLWQNDPGIDIKWHHQAHPGNHLVQEFDPFS